MITDIDWVIVGSRRWARVIANEVCKSNSSSLVKMCDDTSDASLFHWIENSPYKDNITVINSIDICPPSKKGIAIIANSAYLHSASIEHALTNGYNVVSEKPMTLSRIETCFLLEKANKFGLKLFSTNTYLFADYFSILKSKYLLNKEVSKIDIRWTDPVSEFRYGQKKSYDSSLPIIYDMLPHIAVIILATYGNFQINKSNIVVCKGGSEVQINLTCDKLLISISLERNSIKRERVIHFFGEALDIKFDFTEEPGRIFLDGYAPIVLNFNEEERRKPIAEMIYSIKKYFQEGVNDERLSSSAAVLANDLIDSVATDYVAQLVSLLKSSKSQNVEESLDFAYMKKELTSLNKRVLPYLCDQSPLHGLIYDHKNKLLIK